MAKLESDMPIFVKIDEYREILDTINLIRNKVIDAKNLLDEIYDLKNKEDEELENWSNGLEEIERRLAFIDKTLFEPEL